MNNKLSDFLKYAHAQKEVSLIIAKDEDELTHFVELLSEAEFRQTIDTHELFKRIITPTKVYYIIRDTLPKNIYDFILQYPTGQIEVFHTEHMKSEVISPLYNNVSVVFLVTKDTLLHIQNQGFQLLENVGIAYQS